MAIEPHVGDTVQFVVTIMNDSGVVNISTASTKQFIFQLPSDYSDLVVDANFYTDGTDGKLTYTTTTTDLSVVGIWKLQGYVVIGSNQWKSNIVSFKVNRNL